MARSKEDGLTEDDLPERMCKLEAPAFEEFSAKYLDQLRAFFAAGGANGTQAEDLALTCVSDICLKVGRFRRVPNSTFRAWVTSIARHKRADWQRKRYRAPTLVFIAEIEDVLANPAPDGEEPDVTLSEQEAVRDAINRLSPLQRSVLELLYAGHAQNATEAGALLGQHPGTVRQAHARALRRVRKMLERDSRMTERLRRMRCRSEALA